MSPVPFDDGALIRFESLSKVYSTGRAEVAALRDISLEIARGEYVAITGPSGSGKTTMMEILGCLARPSAGRYVLGGRVVADLAEKELARLRLEEIGFVFQSFNLLPRLSAQENCELPLMYRRVPRRERRTRAMEALERVGLEARAHHIPGELSGGERQRVAIARALINRPSFVLADEPTGNLDTTTGEEILSLLSDVHADGKTVVLVTHNPDIAKRTGRRLLLRDGQVEHDAALARPRP